MEPSKMWLQPGILIFECSADNNITNENIGRGNRAGYFPIPGRLFKLLEFHPECYQAPTLPPSLRDYSGKQAFREELGNISTGIMS